MNKKTLKTLEYNKVIEMLVSKADSSPGKELCQNLEPLHDMEAIELLQLQTGDALRRIYKYGSPLFSGVRNIKGSFLRLEVGGTIGAAELLNISSLLECALRVKSYNGEEPDSLTAFFTELQPLSPVQKEISRCIISEEEISDDKKRSLQEKIKTEHE